MEAFPEFSGPKYSRKEKHIDFKINIRETESERKRKSICGKIQL